MKYDGIFIALAFPDHFVRATESKYNKFLRTVGIVNENMVRAGHSSAALINKKTGEVRYADFGRYVTPFGKGRARTHLTDPEVHVPVLAKFDKHGNCINLKEILFFFRDRPHLTKGDGACFAGCFDVRYDQAWNYMRTLSLKGSIPYGPFDIRGNNCSRFTWNALMKSQDSLRFKLKMFLRFAPTVMPMDIVMLAKRGRRFEVGQDRLIPVNHGQWKIWMRLFERYQGKEKEEFQRMDTLGASGNWLDGLGAQAFFNLKQAYTDRLLIERKHDPKQAIFCHFFTRPVDFDPEQPFEFIHDCNAMLCTLLQNRQKMILYKMDEEVQKETLTFHQPLSKSASLRS